MSHMHLYEANNPADEQWQEITKDLTIIVPAYNEEENIQPCLQRVRDELPYASLIVINDGSTDATAERAEAVEGAVVVRHTRNRGYGAALKTGIRMTTTPYVLWFDADGQHRVEDILGLVLPVAQQEADAMLGQRTKASAFSVKRMPGKWLLKIVSQVVARQRIPDLNCGLRCFRTSVIRRYLHLLPDGFSASATSTLVMIRRGYRVGFSPITAEKRVGNSTVRIVRDGLKTLSLIMRIMLLFDALRFFTACALVQMVAALAYSLYKITTVGWGIPPLGALVFTSGMLTFFMGMISAQISEMRQERFEFMPDALFDEE
ncbi:MAG: glycosyltransferase family 2 protein [Bdellovibrionales bacterium]|nr:glycosyltransferase family 2 protein [Bdellovibrionales bacterium]